MTEKEPSEFTEEVRNRLVVWQLAIEKARNYLRMAGHISENKLLGNEYLRVEHSQLLIGPCAGSAMAEMALVYFFQVFSSANSGPGFASNRDDTVAAIRDEMVAHAKRELNWPEDEFNEAFSFFQNARNQLVAHYDGTAANYRKPIPGVTAMKMLGASLNKPLRDRFYEIVSSMNRYLRRRLKFPEPPPVPNEVLEAWDELARRRE